MTATSAQPHGDLLWSVTVEAGDAHHRAWQDLGQADIDRWCSAHGLDSRDVRQVTVHGYTDGSCDLEVEVAARGTDGCLLRDHTAHGLRRHALLISLVQSLPEGVGHVIRW